MPLPPARTIFIGGIAIIGAVLGYLMLRAPDTKPPLGGADGPAPGALARPVRTAEASPAEAPGGKPSTAAPAPKPAPKRQKVAGSPVDDLLDRWDALVAERKGPEDKMALVKEALEKLDVAGLGDFIAELHARRGGDALDWLVAQAADKNLALASRNVPNVALTTGDLLNTYDVLRPDKLVFTRTAFEQIEARLGKE